ncbi:MAG: CsbD family protein [Nitrospirota bacterium]|nr:CsbD family protein [Nitrospirota bacterium]MDP2381989.1 CsbD family protein [Nitrospirota bacterium]MDP3599206.1 CsbD family protein [Nitrospirota bacterium]
MNAEQLKEKWMQFKGELTQQYGKFADDNVDQIEGNVDTLIGTVQERCGENNDAFIKGADRWQQQPGPQRWGSSPTEWMRFTRD